MIYLDVTSAASHSNHMGVHRTVRGIHHYLNQHQPDNLVPLCWDFNKKRYATLSPREMKFLTNSTNDSEVSLKYQKWTRLRGVWLDYWPRHQRRVALNSFLKAGDCLFIPDLCWDARIYFWPQLRKWPG